MSNVIFINHDGEVITPNDAPVIRTEFISTLSNGDKYNNTNICGIYFTLSDLFENYKFLFDDSDRSINKILIDDEEYIKYIRNDNGDIAFKNSKHYNLYKDITNSVDSIHIIKDYYNYGIELRLIKTDKTYSLNIKDSKMGNYINYEERMYYIELLDTKNNEKLFSEYTTEYHFNKALNNIDDITNFDTVGFWMARDGRGIKINKTRLVPYVIMNFNDKYKDTFYYMSHKIYFDMHSFAEWCKDITGKFWLYKKTTHPFNRKPPEDTCVVFHS